MVRRLVVAMCLLLALGCGYGLLAAREPGNSPAWSYGYFGGLTLFLATVILLFTRRL